MRSTSARRPFDRCAVRIGPEVELLEHGFRVDRQDLLGVLRSNRANTIATSPRTIQRVAVANQKCRTGPLRPVSQQRRQPDLAGAAANPVLLVVLFRQQRWQLAANVDYVAVALLPISEEGKISGDVVDGGHCLRDICAATIRGKSGRNAKKSASGKGSRPLAVAAGGAAKLARLRWLRRRCGPGHATAS